MHAGIVVMTLDPIDHVAAIACAGRSHAVSVEEGIAPQDFSDAVHNVNVGFAAPVFANLVDELLSVASRTARVWHKNNVAAVGPNLRIPAITPTVVERALWTTVNDDGQRIFLLRIKVCRLDDEAMNLLAKRADPFHLLRFSQTEWGHLIIVHIG